LYRTEVYRISIRWYRSLLAGDDDDDDDDDDDAARRRAYVTR
jgi:hypothetical protein